MALAWLEFEKTINLVLEGCKANLRDLKKVRPSIHRHQSKVNFCLST